MLPRSPLAGSQHPVGAWTGRELVVLVDGTNPATGKPFPAALARAAAYDPSARRWRRIAPPPALPAGAAAAWDGHELLVVGGRSALAWDPWEDRWRTLAPAPSPRVGARALWTGTRLLLVGGGSAAPLAYDPKADRWAALPAAPLPARLQTDRRVDRPLAARVGAGADREVGLVPIRRRALHARGRDELELRGRPDPPAVELRQRVEDCEELPLRPRRSAVGGAGCGEVGIAVARSAAVRPAGEPVAVVPVGGDRRLCGALKQIRRPQRLDAVGNGERGELLEEALPVALDAFELHERAARCEGAVEDAADRGRHGDATVARLLEDVLDLRRERVGRGVRRAACAVVARERGCDAARREHGRREPAADDRPTSRARRRRRGFRRRRGRVRRRRAQRRVLAQDRRSSSRSSGARLDAELVDERLRAPAGSASSASACRPAR